MSNYNRKEREQSQISELYLFSKILWLRSSSSTCCSWEDLHLRRVAIERIFIFFDVVQQSSSASSLCCSSCHHLHLHLLTGVAAERIHLHSHICCSQEDSSSSSSMCVAERIHLHLLRRVAATVIIYIQRVAAVVIICIFEVLQPRGFIFIFFDVLQLRWFIFIFFDVLQLRGFIFIFFDVLQQSSSSASSTCCSNRHHLHLQRVTDKRIHLHSPIYCSREDSSSSLSMCCSWEDSSSTCHSR